MKRSHIFQPVNGAIGDCLIHLFSDSRFNRCVLVVAWAKHSAILLLERAIRDFRERGGELIVYVGVDMQGTSYEALCDLLRLCNRLYVIHSTDSFQTYHPKLYFFMGKDEAQTIIGSSNLTVGGLWRNIELCEITAYDYENPEDQSAVSALNEGLNSLIGKSPLVPKHICTLDEIDLLMKGGLIGYEAKVRLRQSRRVGTIEKVQGAENAVLQWFQSYAPVKEPKTNSTNGSALKMRNVNEERTSPKDAASSQITVESQQENYRRSYDVLWVETGRLTGGSANQLDLSMTAILQRGNGAGTQFDLGEQNKVCGSLVFFGVDPNNPTQEKMITISYEGHTYRNNRIYMPSDSKRNNGTWRLQLNGVDPVDGSILTKSMQRGYLKHKVLVFERVADSHYALSVFPNNDLDEFINGSGLVAKNGTGRGNARYFGAF